MITRRIFLKDGGLALVGLGAMPVLLRRTVLSAAASSSKKLVVIFMRGGADGFNIVVPYGEAEYYRRRPSIAIPRPASQTDSALDLDGFFGLHPALGPLQPYYQRGNLAIVNAVGSPAATRSHFEAQDFMETAAPGNHRVRDGWLNRYLAQAPGEASAVRGVSMGQNLALALKGEAPATALGDLSDFSLRAGPAADVARTGYETLYHQDTNSLLSGTAEELFEAMDLLRKVNPRQYRPAAGANYPRGRFGQNLLQIAQLIKAQVGLEVAFVSFDGWDHHFNEGGVRGQLSRLLDQFSRSLAAFCLDLGKRMKEVVILTMSEFGRTLHENGAGGTDHGRANFMFLLGGPVKGDHVYGPWPGLSPHQLNDGRDLALTTDFRDVFAEVMVRHLGCQSVETVLPDFSLDPGKFTGAL